MKRIAGVVAAVAAAICLTAGAASASPVHYQSPPRAVYSTSCHTHFRPGPNGGRWIETCWVFGEVTGPSHAYVEAYGNAPMATLTYYEPYRLNGFSVTECLALYPPLVNYTADLAPGQRVFIVASLTAISVYRPDLQVSLLALSSVYVNPVPPPTPGPCG